MGVHSKNKDHGRRMVVPFYDHTFGHKIFCCFFHYNLLNLNLFKLKIIIIYISLNKVLNLLEKKGFFKKIKTTQKKIPPNPKKKKRQLFLKKKQPVESFCFDNKKKINLLSFSSKKNKRSMCVFSLFIKQQYRPQSVKSFIHYNIIKIIKIYRILVAQLLNYYISTQNLNDLYPILNYIKFSCALTLARKLKLKKMSKIFKRFGKNLIIGKNTAIKKTNIIDLKLPQLKTSKNPYKQL